MSDQDLTISIKATLDGVKEALETVKDLFKKGADAAKAMSEMVGGDLSDSLKKVAADSEALGPALEAAFSPLAVIAFAKAIVDASDKLSKFISDTFIYTDADKKAVEQIKDENKVLLELANRTKEANRQRQLLMAPNDSARDKLKLQFQIEDQGGSAQQLQAQLKELTTKYQQDLAKSTQKVKVDIVDPEMGFIVGQTEELSEDAKKAAKEVEELQGQITILGKRADEEAAIEGRIDAQLKKDQGREAQEAALRREEARRKDIALEIAKLDGQKKVSDAIIQQKQQELQTVLRQDKLGAEAELVLHKDLVNQKFAADEQYLQAKLAQLKRDPERNAQQIVAVNAQLEALQVQRNTALLKLDDDYHKQVEKNGQEAVNKAAANNKKLLADIRAAMEARLQAAAEEGKTEIQVQEQAVEQRLALGKISKQQEITQLAALKQQELQIEIDFLKKREQLYRNDAKKIEEIEGQINKLQRQAAVDAAKATTESLKAQQQSYQQYFNRIASSFTNMINGLLQGNETIAQAFQKLYAGLLQELINYEAQRLEKEAATAIQSMLFRKANAAADIGASAGKAFAAVFADMASLGPAGAAAAPGAAAAASSSVLSGGLALLNTPLEVGTWNVPSTMPALLHAGEIVMPAFESNMFRNLAANVSQRSSSAGQQSGSPLHVHFHVNAIDGADAASFIQKNANNITSVLYKQMRKKGLQIG